MYKDCLSYANGMHIVNIFIYYNREPCTYLVYITLYYANTCGAGNVR